MYRAAVGLGPAIAKDGSAAPCLSSGDTTSLAMPEVSRRGPTSEGQARSPARRRHVRVRCGGACAVRRGGGAGTGRVREVVQRFVRPCRAALGPQVPPFGAVLQDRRRPLVPSVPLPLPQLEPGQPRRLPPDALMGWRFQRRRKILPGVTLNVGRRSGSVSV